MRACERIPLGTLHDTGGRAGAVLPPASLGLRCAGATHEGWSIALPRGVSPEL